MRRAITLLAVVAGALLLLLAACGGDEEEAQPAEEAAEPAAVSTEGLRVAYASDLDPNDIADQFGLRAAGAKVIELTEDSAVVAGLIRGDVDVGNIGLTEAIKATQTGVPLKIFGVSQRRFEFVMVSQPEITDLSQLAGKRVAYHAPGSGTEILQRVLVRQFDPALEKKIKWVVLPESPNRAAAMLAKRIDVTSLEFADVLTLQGKGDFNVLGEWGDITGPSANAISTVWVASEEFFSENKRKLEALAQKLQEGYGQVYEDKQAWMDLAQEILPDVEAERLSKSYDFYVDQQMYPVAGEPPLTAELWKQLDGFFREIGEYEDPASDEIVAYDLIEKAAGA